jgi:membrane-bound serine protease (ClpP class)
MIMVITMALPILGLPLFYFLSFSAALPAYLCLLVLSGLMYYGMFSVMGKRRKVQTGLEQMIGEEAVVTEDIDPEGRVEIGDEIWKAKAHSKKFQKGKKVRIIGAQGLVLVVEDLDGKDNIAQSHSSKGGNR